MLALVPFLRIRTTAEWHLPNSDLVDVSRCAHDIKVDDRVSVYPSNGVTKDEHPRVNIS